MSNEIAVADMSDEEAAEVFGEDAEADAAEAKLEVPGDLPENPSAELPTWATAIPPAVKVPLGTTVTWIRVRGAWMQPVRKEDRVLMVWPLSENEERQAISRARGEQARLVTELAKGVVRTIDGVPVDRTMTPGHPLPINSVWSQLGPKGRALVRAYYTRMHTLTDEEQKDFFMNCTVTRSAVPG